MWANAEAGEPEPAESGQRKTVSVSVFGVRRDLRGCRSLSLRDVRDIKRLYLSGRWTAEDCSGGGETDDNQGNPLSCKFMTDACYNLVYLELAACRLTSLAANFSSLVPNVRVLNLNYNFLEDVGPLEGLSRVKKLSIIGSRVKGTKGLIRMVQRMGEIEMVDFRYEMPFLEGTAGISFGTRTGPDSGRRGRVSVGKGCSCKRAGGGYASGVAQG